MNHLSEAAVTAIRENRQLLRDRIEEIPDIVLRQWFLAYHGFRNGKKGPHKKVSRTMTVALRQIISQISDAVTDREIAQYYNLAIGDVSNVRRGTRR